MRSENARNSLGANRHLLDIRLCLDRFECADLVIRCLFIFILNGGERYEKNQ